MQMQLHILMIALSGLAGAAGPASLPGAPAPRREVSIDSVIVTPLRADSSTATYEVLFAVADGDTFRSRVRRPAAGLAGEHPVAFLMVGFETGREAVDLIEGHDAVVVFAMDYPFEGEFDPTGWGGIAAAIGLRDMAFTTVRNAGIALDWLTRLPEVDTTDVTMIAVSFGVFTGVHAAAADTRFRKLAVVQGGGRIDEVIAANVERLGIPFPPWLAGKLGLGLLSSFEPNDHVGTLAPRPFILVSGDSDRFFPKGSAQSLYDAAREPKEWVRHQGPHLMPGERELIRTLTGILAKKLYGPE